MCPISHFQCSAAGLATSGAIYLGTNLEFGGKALRLCETVHAEQFVVANAVQHGERALLVCSPGTRDPAYSVHAAPEKLARRRPCTRATAADQEEVRTHRPTREGSGCGHAPS